MEQSKKVPVLRFPEFSWEWEVKKLGKLADITTGNKDTQNKVDNGIYPFFVRSQNVEKINSFSYDGEAILTSGDGDGKNFHYINGKFDFHQRVYCIFNFKNGVNGKYIFFYFSEKFYKRVMRMSAKNSVDSVRMDIITDMSIFIPLFSEQQKIADFLTQIDNKINQLSQKKQLLERYKKGVMQQIFSQSIRFKDDDGREFPEWEEKEIGSISDKITAGGTPSTLKKEYWNGNIRWMNSGELNLKKVYEVENRITKLGLSNSSTKIIPPKCTLIGLAGQGKTRGTVAMNMVELCTNQSIASIYPKPEIFYEEFLYHNLDFRYDELRGLSTGDGGRGGLNLQIIKSMDISLPCLEEQTKIANFLTALDNKIALVEKQLNGTKQYKKGLLQQLFI